ncbi:MAG: phosphotransferase family protein [Xanthomonadales bacterium]|nr:phosphotransferase family protein [Xanthomonadales bacterium]
MNTAIIDRGGAVRAGEELSLERLDPWLHEQIPGLEGQPEVTQYSGGASNWTYRLKYSSHDLILRRGPAGTKAKGAHDMGREFRLQQALAPVFPYVPRMYVWSGDSSLIGAEFYLMERMPGIIPRKNLPRGLELSRTQVSELCRNALDVLIALHEVDVEQAGLSGLAKGEGYTERQIIGWSKRYRQARTWNVMRGEKIIGWLERNLPKRELISLTHNDYRFDNLVLDPADPTRIIGVLDWELATLGDPLMDLGNSLAYWVEAGDDFLAQSTRRQPTHLPGMMTRREVMEYYCDKRNMDVQDWRFYQVYGLFRLAGIAQQIYYRYHHGQTRNPAFKRFWLFVNYLLWRCGRLMN